MIPYLNLAVYACVSFAAGFFISSLHVSTWLLQGLHSYLYPDAPPAQEHQDARGGSGFTSMKGKEAQNYTKSMSDTGGERDNSSASMDCNKDGEEVGKSNNAKAQLLIKKREQKKKDKNKDKFKWEEGSSQIYRLTLSRTHVMGRLYFAEYDEVMLFTAVGLANLVAHECLSYISHALHMVKDEQASKYDIIPFFMGLFAVYKIVRLLAQVGWQTSTSRASEILLSVGVGIIGFFAALCILFFPSSFILDIGLETLFGYDTDLPSASGSGSRKYMGLFMGSPTLARVFVAVIAGLLAGILVAPAHRIVRSFWLGTDQLQWNIPMAKWGSFVRFLLYLDTALPLFVSVLWIKPMGELFVTATAFVGRESDSQGTMVGVRFWGRLLLPAPSDDWARDFGLPRNLFAKAEFWGLLVAGVLHLCLFRVNVQAYLNEALIVWYEGLHRSKVMNLELTRAKLLLNSYFLCRAAVQFFVPGMLVVLLLGMSRLGGDVVLLSEFAETRPNLFFLRVIALFMGWWTMFCWSILTSSTLALYRAGFLLVS